MAGTDRTETLTFERVSAALVPHGLAVVGVHRPDGDPDLPDGTRALALVGPDRDRMWPVFSSAPEYADGRPDPLDRWSRRVLDAVAADLGGAALYPFGGPPFRPFMRWAAAGEGARPSPICLLITPDRGLWVSYRGALAFAATIDAPARIDRDPCLGCAAPCLSACPVDAFAGSAYDVRACLTHLVGAADADCHNGCRARRACPAAEPPPAEQRRFHMAAFVASGRHRV